MRQTPRVASSFRGVLLQFLHRRLRCRGAGPGGWAGGSSAGTSARTGPRLRAVLPRLRRCWGGHGTQAAAGRPMPQSPPASTTDVLTTSTVPAIKTNSLVTISTISRTCKRAGSTSVPAEPRGPWPRGKAAQPHLSGVGAGVNAQQTRVLVAVVVGGRIVHPVVPARAQERCHSPKRAQLGQGPNTPGHGTPDPPVEHVEVEPGEHALAGPTGREGAAPAHHHVQHCKRDEVPLLWGHRGGGRGGGSQWGEVKAPPVRTRRVGGMKSPSCRDKAGGAHGGGGDIPLRWEAGAALSRAVGRTRKEQLSRPIMMCVSSGNGVGPRLTLDMSLSSCNQAERACVLRYGPLGLGAPQAKGSVTRPTEVVQ